MKNTPASSARQKQETLQHACIGKPVRVLPCACKAVQDLEGVVLDETKSTFLVQTRRGPKRVPKKNTRFAFPFGIVDGNDILCAPDERLKRL